MAEAPSNRIAIGEEVLGELFDRANTVLDKVRASALEPEKEKILRRFTLKEATRLLGIHTDTFYELKQDPTANIPTGEKGARRRLFTLPEIHAIQEHLKLLPRQKINIRQAVTLTVANFKGGVAKTFTAVSLAQYFAMRGYRTLAIDLDPQGSLTTTFGVNPATDVDDWQTILPYFYGRAIVEREGHAWPESLRPAIQPTYWHGLDLVAANLNLYSGDFALGIRRDSEPEFRFHRPLLDAIDTIRADYDIVIVDTPPSLSFSTSTAICAADGLLIPAPAAMMDFESARYFLKLTKEVLSAVRNSYNIVKEFEFLRVLITKFQPAVAVQQKLANWQRGIFDEFCLSEPMLLSNAVQNLGPTLQTLYEAGTGYRGSREALKRALESVNAVNGLIEQEVVAVLKRWAATEAAPGAVLAATPLNKPSAKERAA
jgi:chromosome partitioning protein